MSEEPPKAPDAPGPAEDHPHGVVETIREEIQEVVEHVPEPVRWTVGKLVRVALLSLAALCILLLVTVVLWLMNRTDLVAHELTVVLNQALAQRSDLELDIPDLKGNPFSGFRALRPRVRFRDGGGSFLDADELRVRYSAFDLLRGKRGPVQLTFVRPVVRLDNGPGGTFRLPTWKPGPARQKPGAPRPIDFQLHMSDGTVTVPKPYGRIDGIALDLAGATGPVASLHLQRMRWAHGPWHSRLEQMEARISSDADSVRFQIPELRTGDLALSAVGGWRSAASAGAAGPIRRLHADIHRVRWGWLAEVFANKTFDVPGTGSASIDAAGSKRWDGRFSAAVTWDSLAATGRSRFAWDGTHLALDSLVAQSAAGNLDGKVRWSKLGWEIGGDARAADPAHWRALRLFGWPAGRLNGLFHYTVDTRGKPSSRLDARLIASEWVGWQVDSARVRVEFPAQGQDSFAVVGWRRGGTFTLRAKVDPNLWQGPYTIADFPLEEWPDGRASGLKGVLTSGSGQVVNRNGMLFVTGDLDGASTDWSAAHFAHWRLSHVDGRLLPTPDMTATLHARDAFFVGIHLDSAAAGLHLGNQSVTFDSLHASAGDTLFTGAGNADWQGAQWHATFTSAAFASSQFAWIAEPPLRFSGDPRGTVFDRVVANDHGAHMEARGRWASPGGFYDFGMDGRGLDLGRLGMPPDLGLSGRGEGHLVVTGKSGDPAWTFEGRARQPGFQGHLADSLSVSLQGSQHRLRVSDFLYMLDGGEARASGEIRSTVHAWPDSLTPTAVLRWIQDAGGWQGTLSARNLPIDHLGALSPQAEGWGGRVTATLALAGRPERPEAHLEGEALNVGWRDYRAQRFETHASYANGMLEISEAKVTMQDVVSTVSGRLPLQLALGRIPVIPDAPMSWRAQVPRGDLKLLPAFVPLIQSARGAFDLDATVAGTTKHPKISGSGHVREGTMRPAGRDEVLESVYADLHFDEAHITVDSLSAKQGRLGRVWGKGAVDLNGSALKQYRFTLAMRSFAASQEGLYALLFDGDFTVVDGPPVHGQRLPQVTGDVRATRGVVEFDFANQSEVQKRAAATEPLFWTYRIHLEAPSNLHWRPPDGDIEFNADLDLEQTADSLLIYGEMHALKGHYFFLSNRFTVTTADLIFDNQKGVDPNMDITAETRLRTNLGGTGSAATGSVTPGTEIVYVHILGRSSQPQIELTSSEGADQRTILGYLTVGTGGLFQSVTDPAQSYLTRQLNAQLSRELSTFFNDAINQWEIQREQGELLTGAGSVYLSVGGDVNPKLSWTVRQRVPGLGTTSALTTGNPFERDVEVEYRVSRFIYLTTELMQRRASVAAGSSTLGNDLNVNLKARWEY